MKSEPGACAGLVSTVNIGAFSSPCAIGQCGGRTYARCSCQSGENVLPRQPTTKPFISPCDPSSTPSICATSVSGSINSQTDIPPHFRKPPLQSLTPRKPAKQLTHLVQYHQPPSPTSPHLRTHARRASNPGRITKWRDSPIYTITVVVVITSSATSAAARAAPARRHSPAATRSTPPL